ncbi:hypothetical protein TWF506_009146 [Arthrobotrys conoides]|uniref:F-box domain-containing protein n=1 Tax=Arthrobotrys conoides TaxID=74498 RepID=A0AAN8RM39_9PEZI
MGDASGIDAVRQSTGPRNMIGESNMLDTSNSSNLGVGSTATLDDETPVTVTEASQSSRFKPFETLPLELLTRTFQYLGTKDLASAALTCDSFCQSAIPILYSSLRLEVRTLDQEDVVIAGVNGSEQKLYTTVSQNPDLVKWLRHLSYRIEKGVVLDESLENEFRSETLNLAEFESAYITTLETEVQLFDMIVDIGIPNTLKKLTIFFNGYQNQDSFYDRIEAFDTEFLPKMLCVKDIRLEWTFTRQSHTILDAFLIVVAIWAEFLVAVPNVKSIKLHCMGQRQSLQDFRPDEDPVPQPIPQRITHVINMMDSLTLTDLRSFSAALDTVAYHQRFELVEPEIGDKSVSIFQVLNKFLERHRQQLASFSWCGPPGQEIFDGFGESQVEPLTTMKKTECLSFRMGAMDSYTIDTLLGTQYFATTIIDNRASLKSMEIGHAVTTSQ